MVGVKQTEKKTPNEEKINMGLWQKMKTERGTTTTQTTDRNTTIRGTPKRPRGTPPPRCSDWVGGAKVGC